MDYLIIKTLGIIILPVLIYFAGVVRKKMYFKQERIANFLKTFNRSRKDGHSKRIIEHLIPSGINNLENDKEIKTALSNIEKIHGRHPLQEHNEEIKRFGYKKFFSWASKEKDRLTKDSILEFIENYKNSLKE